MAYVSRVHARSKVHSVFIYEITNLSTKVFFFHFQF